MVNGHKTKGTSIIESFVRHFGSDVMSYHVMSNYLLSLTTRFDRHLQTHKQVRYNKTKYTSSSFIVYLLFQNDVFSFYPFFPNLAEIDWKYFAAKRGFPEIFLILKVTGRSLIVFTLCKTSFNKEH